MTLNARLNLESLDGRWLPDATPTGTTPTFPPFVHSEVPIPAALSEDFLKDLADLSKSVGSIHDLLVDYAHAVIDLRATSARVKQLQEVIANFEKSNQDTTDLVRELGRALATQTAASQKVGQLGADYRLLVKSIEDQIDDIKTNYGYTLTIDIPALDSLVDIVSADDNVPLPPGVG